MADQGVVVVSHALSGASAGLNDAVLRALVRRDSPSDVAQFVASHPDLVVRLVDARPDLLNSPEAWNELVEGAASTLLRSATLSQRSIVAAIRAGHGVEVLKVSTPDVVASAVLNEGTYADARNVLGSMVPEQLLREPTDDRRVLLSIAMWGSSQIEADLPARLERSRGQADEFWLRAAVEALSSTVLPRSEVLTATFGLLHDAITADRLPRECWNRLDGVLPPAGDPALRLRRYLLAVAQEERWTTEQFQRALRGAGPHAGQLLHDFADDADWWVVATRAVIQAAVGVLGGRR